MKEILEVYRYLDYAKEPAPKSAAEFEHYLAARPEIATQIRSGDYVVAFGSLLSKNPAQANQVLVYEKKAPSEGGAVLLRDGTIKQMTAAEFNAAPKARG